MSWLLSLLWQGFLGLFGVSDAQKLGRGEVENQNLKAALKEKENEATVFSAPPRSESVVDAELLRHAGK